MINSNYPDGMTGRELENNNPMETLTIEIDGLLLDNGRGEQQAGLQVEVRTNGQEVEIQFETGSYAITGNNGEELGFVDYEEGNNPTHDQKVYEAAIEKWSRT